MKPVILGAFSAPQQKQTATTNRMRITRRQRKGGEGRGRIGNRPMRLRSFAHIPYLHIHIHTLARVHGELGNASAHWAVPCARPGLPAVVVSENFGNKLTRGPRERARTRGDLAAPRRWQWQRAAARIVSLVA